MLLILPFPAQVLHDKALTERDAPVQGAMVPPSYGELVDMIDGAFPAGQAAGPSSVASPHDRYKAASAALWVAKYNMKKNIPPKVVHPLDYTANACAMLPCMASCAMLAPSELFLTSDILRGTT